MRPIVVVPARMASSRLPGKALADISGVPMIVHAMMRAREADLGPVIVAAGDPEIADAVRRYGGVAVNTNPLLPSGSDRTAAALRSFDPHRNFDTVMNLQGDMPTAEPAILRVAPGCLDRCGAEVATLACPIRSDEELNRSAVVKVAIEPDLVDQRIGHAIYFSRAAIPYGTTTFLHHIGLYVYRRSALERFVDAPPSALELMERLEQLRALSLGMRVGVAIVDIEPLGVDTYLDLEEARRRLTPSALRSDQFREPFGSDGCPVKQSISCIH
jgi:3-deoxy-manno-octulosonate cytidylyltransferase (CMP-KDO synthetase)